MTRLPDSFFSPLSDDEKKEFKEWARFNYKPGSRINPTWHPIVQDECHEINKEVGVIVKQEQ